MKQKEGFKKMRRLFTCISGIFIVASCSYNDYYDFYDNNDYKEKDLLFKISESFEFAQLLKAQDDFNEVILENDTSHMQFEGILLGKKIYSQIIDDELYILEKSKKNFDEAFPVFCSLPIEDKYVCQSLAYSNSPFLTSSKKQHSIIKRTKGASPESNAVLALSAYLPEGQMASPDVEYSMSNGNIIMKAWSPYETITKCRSNSVSQGKEWAGYIWNDSGILVEDKNATSTQMTIRHLKWDKIPEDPIYAVHCHPNIVYSQSLQMSEDDKTTFTHMQDHIAYFVILAQNGAKKFTSITDTGTLENM